MLIDAHAHLNELEAVDEAIAAARRAGIGQIVAVGMDRRSNHRTLELAQRHPGVVLPAIGLHPWRLAAENIDSTLAQIEGRIDRCIALGEVGLDYKVKVKKALQWRVFEEILQLAARWDKAVIVHCRFSHARAHRMVQAAGVRCAVFHWYSGPSEILQRILADGYYISATPALAYSPPHRRAAALAPLDRILIETDSPVAYRGVPSQPAHLRATLAALSRLKRVPEHTLAQHTIANTRRLLAV
jgi:TatD DNase family protein